MRKIVLPLLVILFLSSLSGCVTTAHPTYTGGIKNAVTESTISFRKFIGEAFLSPMPSDESYPFSTRPKFIPRVADRENDTRVNIETDVKTYTIIQEDISSTPIRRY
jgi:hypothetical protein